MRVYSGHQNVSNLMRKLLDDASDFHLIHVENEKKLLTRSTQLRSKFPCVGRLLKSERCLFTFDVSFIFSLESYSTSYSN